MSTTRERCGKSKKLRSSGDPSVGSVGGRHILELSDALAHALGFLSVKKMCECEVVSIKFRRRCRQALRLMKAVEICDGEDRVNLNKKVMEGCVNLRTLWTEIQSTQELCLTPTLSKLQELLLGFETNIADDIVAAASRNLPNLRTLTLFSKATFPRVNVKPLCELKNLQILALIFLCFSGVPDGLGLVVEKCPISTLGIALPSLIHLMNSRERHSLKKITSLGLVVAKRRHVRHEALHANHYRDVARWMPGLEELCIFGSIPNLAFRYLSCLRLKMMYLDMSYYNASTTSDLFNEKTLPHLEFLYYDTDGATSQDVLDLLARAHRRWKIGKISTADILRKFLKC